ncbi:MAG: methionyl-tRNA formyltransferase, partial [Mycetocola sp.]
TEKESHAVRIVFAGTPEPAVPVLHALHAAGHNVVAVVTRPDAPLGRKRVLTPSPVAAAATELGIPVLKHAALGDEATDEIASYAPDLGVVVAYGGLVRQRLLDLPQHGWINLHFSVLPAWRGAAPVQRALMNGGEGLGTSIFQLVPELDAGDLFDVLPVDPGPDATAAELLPRLAELGAPRVVAVVDGIKAGTAVATPQRGTPTHAAKLSAPDGHLDPSEPTAELVARFRGVTTEPGAFVLRGDNRIKVHALRAGPEYDAPVGTVALLDGRVCVSTADGSLEFLTVQPAGKQRMTAQDWWRGLSAEEVVVS